MFPHGEGVGGEKEGEEGEEGRRGGYTHLLVKQLLAEAPYIDEVQLGLVLEQAPDVIRLAGSEDGQLGCLVGKETWRSIRLAGREEWRSIWLAGKETRRPI